MASEGYKHAGDIEVESATLILTDGTTVDISALVREANIYQDLFKHYIEADFVMDDSVSLFGSGSLGTEVVEISFRNSVGPNTDSEFVRHVFYVYEISDRQRISEFREMYIMNCISVESYLANPRKISRSFGPSTISNMIKRINNEFLYNSGAKSFYSDASKIFGYTKSKTGTFDDTQGEHQIIVPNMSVDDAIDFLSMEADSAEHIPYYTFYEDADGFNFRNLYNLVTQSPIATYHHLPSLTDVPTEQTNNLPNFDDTFKILAYNLVKQSNVIQNSNSGLFKQKTINLDILRRNKKEVVYNYDTYGDKFAKIENKIQGLSADELSDPVVILTTTRKGHDSDKTLEKEKHLPKKINQVQAIRKGYQKHLFNLVMEVTVPGNDKIKVGQIVELLFYASINNEVSLELYDKYLSGNYLITKVRQKITGATSGSEYVTVIECTRDGIREN